MRRKGQPNERVCMYVPTYIGINVPQKAFETNLWYDQQQQHHETGKQKKLFL